MPKHSAAKRKMPSSKGPTNKRSTKRQAVDVSDDDSDSGLSDNQQATHDEQRPLSPMPDSTTKLPEELLQSFYKPPGVLLIAGMVSWDLVAKRDNNPNNLSHPNLYSFHKFTERKYRFAASSCSAGHSVLIGDKGEAYTFGRNTYGQLGLGDTVTRDTPTLVPELAGKNVIHAAVGRHHTLFVIDTGTVYACGDNKSGQCGIGTVKTPQLLSPTRVRHTGAPIVKVGCGGEFSMILDCNGALHSFGLPEYGQLGHNSDGKYFVTSSKLSFCFDTVPKVIKMFVEKTKQGRVVPVKDVIIADFSCGTNHTVAIDSQKRAFSWGFGGFGRLGHAEQRDEAIPRLIKYFDTQARGVHAIYCGATYSLAVTELALFMFGQTKRTGEANMYPKPVPDLTGWNVRSVGTSNSSVVISADDSLVAWGVSPTYGELGLGEINKSTARPREVASMDGLNITHVTMGYSHTLLLSDDSTEVVRKSLAKKPVFNP